MVIPNNNMNEINICALGSGSRGNAFVLGTSAGSLLVDAGFSRREILCRMDACGLDPRSLLGVLLTHEHQDHFKGCRILCDELGIPLYLSCRTADFLRRRGELPREVVLFEPGDNFSVGVFGVSPFSVPHDAVDPVGFVISFGESRIGIATDLGEFNRLAQCRLQGCDAIILESNYDREMLYNSNRMLHLKRRIHGRSGHLDNLDCAAALPELISETTRVLLLVHVSSECNSYDMVNELAGGVLKRLGREDMAFAVVHQDRPTPVFRIGVRHG